MTLMEAVASEAFSPIITMLGMAAKASGLFIILGAIFKLKKYAIAGDYSEFSPGQLIITMLVGVLLWHTDQFMLDWQQTIFRELHPYNSALAYPVSGGSELMERFASAQRAIFLFIQIWGYFSFIRGLHCWHQTTLGYKNSSFWKGFFHCLGGVIGVNVNLFAPAVLDFLTILNPLGSSSF